MALLHAVVYSLRACDAPSVDRAKLWIFEADRSVSPMLHKSAHLIVAHAESKNGCWTTAITHQHPPTLHSVVATALLFAICQWQVCSPCPICIHLLHTRPKIDYDLLVQGVPVLKTLTILASVVLHANCWKAFNWRTSNQRVDFRCFCYVEIM